MSDFDTFWASYPRRESRAAAMREYIHARRLVSAETILAGLARYLNHLPREREYIKKPQNWLRDADWDNEYDEPAPSPSVSMDWFTECQARHGGACGGSLKHHTRMLIEKQRERSA